MYYKIVTCVFPVFSSEIFQPEQLHGVTGITLMAYVKWVVRSLPDLVLDTKSLHPLSHTRSVHPLPFVVTVSRGNGIHWPTFTGLNWSLTAMGRVWELKRVGKEFSQDGSFKTCQLWGCPWGQTCFLCTQQPANTPQGSRTGWQHQALQCQQCVPKGEPCRWEAGRMLWL